MPKKWWYDTISGVLKDLNAGDGYPGTMFVYAEQARDQLMQKIAQEQPYGHVEYDPDGFYAKPPNFTVSDRLGHTSIEEGWRPEYIGLASQIGIRLKLSNVSQHIRHVLEGAPAHDQPTKGGPMFFWWGEPQRWPAPEYHRETGREMGPGYYQFSQISHPGQDPNQFVRRAKNLAKPDMADTIKAGVTEYITNLMANNGLQPET